MSKNGFNKPSRNKYNQRALSHNSVISTAIFITYIALIIKNSLIIYDLHNKGQPLVPVIIILMFYCTVNDVINYGKLIYIHIYMHMYIYIYTHIQTHICIYTIKVVVKINTQIIYFGKEKSAS